jgi:hypothetical protein
VPPHRSSRSSPEARRATRLAQAAAAETAYQAIRAKINLDSPDQSRLVVRLRDDETTTAGAAQVARPTRRPCWMPSTRSPVSSRSPRSIRPADLEGPHVVRRYGRGGRNRYEAATIAKYEFKTGMGAIVYDTSGHEPALNLTLSGGTTGWAAGASS